MQLVNILTENEIKLLNKAQIDYSKEDANMIITEVTEFIMSHSQKNGDVAKLQDEYSGLLKKLDKVS
ncbi:MAG: hypothetical protein IJJ82_05140 [Clostridia bacterium]|nr:hypothetical protein [Clostridia bacterium]